MDEFIKENAIPLFSAGIAVLSFVAAMFSLSLNRKNARLNSYTLKGNYSVFLKKESIFKKIINGADFNVKINNSITSDTIPLGYNIQIVPLIGGIRRCQFFDVMEEESHLGISETVPVVRTYKNRQKFPKRYAHHDLVSFSETPFYSYFSVEGKYDKEHRSTERKLNRYHRYIEITDYCGNTEIWYFSFSLCLSNLKNDTEREPGWEYYRGTCSNFKYYKFIDFVIISPKDLPKNLNKATTYKNSLSDITGIEGEFGESENFVKKGYYGIGRELKLYEIREYHKFLQRLNKYKFI